MGIPAAPAVANAASVAASTATAASHVSGQPCRPPLGTPCDAVPSRRVGPAHPASGPAGIVRGRRLLRGAAPLAGLLLAAQLGSCLPAPVTAHASQERAATAVAGKNDVRGPLPHRHARWWDMLAEPCARFDIPRELVLALIRQESDGEELMINIQGRDVRPASLEEARRIARDCQARRLSFDVGLMQVNSQHMREYGIDAERLLDPRENLLMGCFLLAESFRRDGFTWKAVGHYHSRTPWRRDDYIRRIRSHLSRVLQARDLRAEEAGPAEGRL